MPAEHGHRIFPHLILKFGRERGNLFRTGFERPLAAKEPLEMPDDLEIRIELLFGGPRLAVLLGEGLPELLDLGVLVELRADLALRLATRAACTLAPLLTGVPPW